VTRDGTIEMMDSLGKPPTHYDFDVNYAYYSRAVQPTNSLLCGLYVLYYLYWRTRGVSMHDILSTLKHPHKNDAIVARFHVMM
jgi:hypothetical protein